MNRREMTTNCEDIQDRIVSYLEGELGETERAAFESHTIACAECATEMSVARRLQAGLDTLSLETCPPSVAAAVFTHAKANPHPVRRRWWWMNWRPALAGAIAAVLLILTGYIGQNGKVASPQFTRAELEQAREQAKWALVYINQLSRKTATDLKYDVLDREVSRRLLRVINPKSDASYKETHHAS